MDPIPSLLKMVASLAVVIGVMFLVAYGVRRFWGTRLGLWRSEPLIQVISTAHFGAKRDIAVLQVGGAYLVVGMTATQISLLTTLDKLPVLLAPVPVSSAPEKMGGGAL